jgi:Xaa-Pro aminopeptidase
MVRGVAIVAGATPTIRNATTHHPFRQDSDFFYLTGFEEPNAVVVLIAGDNGCRYVLFVQPRDPEREVWDGKRAGVEGAKSTYGADDAYVIDELESRLPALLEGAETLFYVPGLSQRRDAVVFAAMRKHRTHSRDLLSGPDTLVDLAALLHEQRIIKEPDELSSLRRAARLGALAHREAMRVTAAGLREYHVQAVLEFVFRAHGSPRNGYNSIVAAGANATTLHYVDNTAELMSDELLLIDAGCEVDYYTCDITRTFPVSGRFSPAQRAVYDVVLDAQRRAIALARPGRTIVEVHEEAVRALTQGMVSLGLLEGDVDALIASSAYKAYYPHRTSHWLGLDVHDAGSYAEAPGQSRVFAPGMVITVEPGLYIPADDERAPESLRGIGVRIEDDVLITDDEPVVLTNDAPKDPVEVERLCQESSRFSPFLPVPPQS